MIVLGQIIMLNIVSYICGACFDQEVVDIHKLYYYDWHYCIDDGKYYVYKVYCLYGGSDDGDIIKVFNTQKECEYYCNLINACK